MSHTALGWIKDRLHYNDLAQINPEGPILPEGKARGILETFLSDDIAHYVISPEILALADNDAVRDSVRAMVKADIRNLPFDPILIEFRHTKDEHHGGIHFVRLQSKPIAQPSDGINKITGKLVPEKERHDIYAYPLVFVDYLQKAFPVFSVLPEDPIRIDFTPEGETAFLAQFHSPDENDQGVDAKIKFMLGSAAVRGMLIAMLMLNTKGVDKVRVDTGKLNKARAKSGKLHIHPYTVVKIGTLYDREGRAHSVSGSGKYMPVHWRAGHVRNQPWGPGRKQTKLIYIEPCLVNYKPETGIAPPVPKHEVTL